MGHRRHVPSAYSATVTSVERKQRVDALVQVRVSWTDEHGRSWAANTYPGNLRTYEAALAYDQTRPARIVLNGNSQVVLIEPADEPDED